MWLKVYVALYVAFNDLCNMKILLCKYKMSFKIDLLMCVKYIEKKQTQYQLPSPFLWDNIQSKIWKGNQEKMSAWGDLTGLFHRYMPEGSTVFLIKKTAFLSTKYGFEGLSFKYWSLCSCHYATMPTYPGFHYSKCEYLTSLKSQNFFCQPW